MANPIILSGHHLCLTESIKNSVRGKSDRLFRHQERIQSLSILLEYDRNGTHNDEFIAKGHIEMAGPPIMVRVATDDLYQSIDELVDKLDRKLRRRARTKIARRHPNAFRAIDLTK